MGTQRHALWLTVILSVLISMAGCQTPAVGAPVSKSLRGSPSWFAIGPDVYHEGSVAEAERAVLALGREPRWFLGFDRAVSREEYEAYLAQHAPGEVVKVWHGGGYYVPTAPPYPSSAQELPLADRGVRLSLNVAPAADEQGVVHFTLALQSRDREVRREVEHRRTNVLPFLFAFYVDGRAVAVPSTAYGVVGGMNAMVPLVEKGGSRKWNLRVDGESLRALLPHDKRPHALCVVGAFADRQHEGYLGGQAVQRLKRSAPASSQPEADLRPILVRSETACVTWDGVAWTPADKRAR